MSLPISLLPVLFYYFLKNVHNLRCDIIPLAETSFYPLNPHAFLLQVCY